MLPVALLALGLMVTPGAMAVPPKLTTPGNLTVQATSAKGATVVYTVTADSGTATVSCIPASGSLFSLGLTRVQCTGRSATGETSQAAFNVTVVAPPPEFSSVPGTITVRVNAVGGAVVRYTAPTARSAVFGSTAVTCSPSSGSTFDLGETQVTCTALDKSGKSGTVSFLVRVLDAVPPPPPSDVLAQGSSSSVTLSWRLSASKDVAGTKVIRLPGAAVVYQGPGSSFTDSEVKAGASYRYLVAAYDRAGNLSRAAAATGVARVTPLILPQDGADLTAPPLLTWRPVATAQYYNVQIWAVQPKGLVKVLSIWPSTNRLQLPGTWIFEGKQYFLAKGAYRWYVWPGIGKLAAARYGKLLGANEFVIVR